MKETILSQDDSNAKVDIGIFEKQVDKRIKRLENLRHLNTTWKYTI